MTKVVHHGDCLEALRGMADNSVDSIVTDPPYGLSFMGKKWDYDVPAVEVWAECLRVLKPGGHLLAFAGTRTQHRMAVRIEDAGFEIRDMIAWVYGSGFPKSLDVSKAIDKAAGAEREVVGSKLGMPGYSAKTAEEGNCFGDGLSNGEAKCSITAPATEAARQWQGWGTALKPALEPITVARKPLEGTVAGNVLEWGTGALNIDGCRVGTEDISGQWDRAWSDNAGEMGARYSQAGRKAGKVVPPGRWPANLIHDGSEEVVALFPDKAGASAPVRGAEASAASVGNVTGERARVPGAFHGDAGSAARFFYCAKASRDDRNEGTESLEQRVGGMVSNTSGQHITRRDEGYEPKPQGNNHPTVKPTDLMRYLCRLVTPAGGLVLDPFAGSGSTGKAAVLEGFEFVGIEREAAYVEIARTRIAHAQALRSAQTIDLFGEAA